jgi:predicted ester cyclase
VTVSASSTAPGVDLARRLVTEILDAGRSAVCDEILTEDFTFSGSDTASSREEFKQALGRMREKFPEMRFAPLTVLADDAVHGGAFLGIEPTGRSFGVQAAYVLTLRGDRIAGATVILNVLDVLAQIGAWPPAGSSL